MLFVAFIARILAIFYNNIFDGLPDGKLDAENYEKLAFNDSQLGIINIINNFTFPDAWFYGKFLSIIYLLIDRDIYFLQLLNILAFMISLYLAVNIKNRIYKNSTIIYPFYFIALYPIIIQYTSLTLKESFFTLFLLLTINELIKWYQTRNLINFVCCNIFIFVGSLFYIASLMALVILWIYFFSTLIYEYIKKNKKNLALITFFYFFVFFTLGSIFYFYEFFLNYQIIYFDKIGNIFSFTKWQYLLSVTIEGDARYPDWIIPNYNYELIYKLIIRLVYFLFSPFFWDITKFSHVVGFIDGLIYLFLFYLIIINLKNIFKNKLLFLLLIIIFAEILLFAIGTGNFGTGLRHRSKFLLILVVISCQFLPKFKFVR